MYYEDKITNNIREIKDKRVFFRLLVKKNRKMLGYLKYFV